VTVLDADGSEVLSRPIQRSRVLTPAVAFQMVTMLQEVVESGTASGARRIGITGPIGGKTGTTDGYHDAWFVGFSTSVVAAVWVGFDQPASIGPDAYAARIALPIWGDFMKRAAATMPARDFPIPPDVTGHELCRVSHLKPLEDCPVYTEYLKEGDEVPSRMCPVHRGSLKQVAARAVQGVLRGIGRSIAGIFGRD
jgi:membrane carboxypeptidase/penicillin-binding protein